MKVDGSAASPHRKVILASGSPRRRKLLEILGLRFIVVPPPDWAEELPGKGNQAAAEFALRQAVRKAEAVHATAQGKLPTLAADTVVALDEVILGKPSNRHEALNMLKKLSGKWHTVYTAVALRTNDKLASRCDACRVKFRELSAHELEWYVSTSEPMDKAGAYAVQGRGALLVERLDGNPQTVVGLPVYLLPELFRSVGLDLLEFVSKRRA